jgi:hypothetical protein
VCLPEYRIFCHCSDKAIVERHVMNMTETYRRSKFLLQFSLPSLLIKFLVCKLLTLLTNSLFDVVVVLSEVVVVVVIVVDAVLTVPLFAVVSFGDIVRRTTESEEGSIETIVVGSDVGFGIVVIVGYGSVGQ